MTRVVGVDGAPGGWAIATATVVGGGASDVTFSDVMFSDVMFSDVAVRFELTLDALVGEVRNGSIEAVAIDMPIGLLNTHPRPADVAARAQLGPRRSSVFPTPLRVTLDADDYVDACERSRAVCGKALSKQAFYLLPKIRELDALIDPADQDRIVEAHPELAFARLAGEPLPHAKATAEGRRIRIKLVTAAFGELPEITSVPITDALDALANLVTAAHVAANTHNTLGGDIDPTGKCCEIVS